MKWEHYQIKRNGQEFGNLYFRIEGEETILSPDLPSEFAVISKDIDERKSQLLEKLMEVRNKEIEYEEKSKRLIHEISEMK